MWRWEALESQVPNRGLSICVFSGLGRVNNLYFYHDSLFGYLVLGVIG